MEQGTDIKRSSRAYRPLLSIEPAVKTVVRKYEIRETAALLISRYAQYMTERSSAQVKEDSVVEHLAFLIFKDKGYRAWASSQPETTPDKAGS